MLIVEKFSSDQSYSFLLCLISLGDGQSSCSEELVFDYDHALQKFLQAEVRWQKVKNCGTNNYVMNHLRSFIYAFLTDLIMKLLLLGIAIGLNLRRKGCTASALTFWIGDGARVHKLGEPRSNPKYINKS